MTLHPDETGARLNMRRDQTDETQRTDKHGGRSGRHAAQGKRDDPACGDRNPETA